MAAHCLGFASNNDTHHNQHQYTGKYLFKDNNYQAVLDRLNNAYIVETNFITFMEEYRDLRKRQTDQLASFSRRSILGLDALSSISIYGTTMQVQRMTYKMLEEQAKLVSDSDDIIQSVIDAYKKQVNERYPQVRFSTKRKHYRAREMKDRFIKARELLQKALDTLKGLNTEQKTKTNEIQRGRIPFERLDSKTDNMPSALREIQRKIAATEEDRKKAEASYIAEATKIFGECDKLEKERLDQIQKTRIAFIGAIHPDHYSVALMEQFETLLSDVKNTQDSDKDVNEWARIQRIRISIPPETNGNGGIRTVQNEAH